MAQQAHKEAIERFQTLRGWIVGSYAQIEFMMADTIVRSQSLADYEHLPKTATFNVTKRAKRFRQLLESEGAIGQDRVALLDVLNRWEASEEIRHFLVHGFAIFRWTRAGDMLMTFRRYMPDLDETDPFREMHFRLDTLQRLRDQLAEEANQAVGLFEGMHDRLGWKGPADMPMRGNGV